MPVDRGLHTGIVVDQNTNRIIDFKINPINSGYIYCNGSEISEDTYLAYDLGTNLVTCEAFVQLLEYFPANLV